MDHGENRAARFARAALDVEEAEGVLEWRTIGAWRYALGELGIIQGYNGLAPWTVRIAGRFAGIFRTLDAARRALESAARAAHYEVAG